LNYLAGVDEAGLGPILGPLVVAGVAMAGPAGADPWPRLSDRGSRGRVEKGKIRVADSKKVYQGEHRLARLEHTALTFWGAWRGKLPRSLTELLSGFSIETARLEACPWYGDLDLRLPLCADSDLLELHAHGLAHTLEREGLEILHMAALPVDAQEFNELIAETDNKSRAHFHAYSRVIGELVALLPAGAHLVADRCGGLTHYLPALRRAYPEARISRLREQRHQSSYAISTGTGSVKVSFAAGGEDRSFPTALASCLAKYLRELMLHLLNQYFCARQPGLRPTAGYYTDGRRFLRDIAPTLDTAAVPRNLLVRCR
jgi:ribonuclease HII